MSSPRRSERPSVHLLASRAAAVSEAYAAAASEQPQVARLNIAAVAKIKMKARKIVQKNSQERFLDSVTMPVPGDLLEALVQSAPEDATCLERTRDKVLTIFANRRVNRVFLVLACIVMLAVAAFGLVIAWAMLGLFLGVHNGWQHVNEDCALCARFLHLNLTAMMVPSCAVLPSRGSAPTCCSDIGLHVDSFCTHNQRIFNLCAKAFVALFSYINFLPIPWRLAVLHHAVCSPRPTADGHDFYGRPSKAIWFALPRVQRQRIAWLLNGAWIFHFCALAGHVAFPYFAQSQELPGVRCSMRT